jgi:hypothetical protein
MERPFSPTQLGLPRLTSPDLQDLPPSWQELIREAPRYGIDAGRPAWRDDTSAGESAEWSVQDPAWGYSAESEALPARGERRARRHSAALLEPDEEDGQWPEEEAWATSRKRRPRRWVGRLVVVVLLLLVLNVGALAVMRPDLCPVSQCQLVSAKAHDLLPFLGQATPAPAVGELPPTVAITVPAGKAASAVVSFTNVASGAITWSAHTDLDWLTVNPVTGSLQPGDSATLTLTATASGISRGTFTTALKITVSGRTTTVSITLTVK